MSELQIICARLNLSHNQITETKLITENTPENSERLAIHDQILKYVNGNKKFERIITFYIKSTNFDFESKLKRKLSSKSSDRMHIIHSWTLILEEIEKIIGTEENENVLYNLLYAFLQKMKSRDVTVILSLITQYHAAKYDLTDSILEACVESAFLPYLTSSTRTAFFEKLIDFTVEHPYILIFLATTLAMNCLTINDDSISIESMLSGMASDDVGDLFDWAFD